MPAHSEGTVLIKEISSELSSPSSNNEDSNIKKISFEQSQLNASSSDQSGDSG
jgi:hypothetical protein